VSVVGISLQIIGIIVRVRKFVSVRLKPRAADFAPRLCETAFDFLTLTKNKKLKQQQVGNSTILGDLVCWSKKYTSIYNEY
jgi:hypothetical protein